MNEKMPRPTLDFYGAGPEDLSKFKPGDPDQDLEAKLNLNMAVLKQAGDDLLSTKKAEFLSAAYFLFSDDSKSVTELNSSKSYEAYAARVKINNKHFAKSVWERLPLKRKEEIEQGLKEEYGIELPDYL